MANYKRKKSKRQVKCNICTDARIGNSLQTGRKPSVILNKKRAIKSEKEQKDNV